MHVTDPVWQDLNNAKDNVCSRMHIVKTTLKFVLDFPEAREHAKPAPEASAKSVDSVGCRFDSGPSGSRR